jgi:hypothetical protein
VVVVLLSHFIDFTRKRAVRCACFCALLALTLLARPARAGDPRLQWLTLSTPNFRIHYHSGLEVQAQRAARASERLLTYLVRWLGKPPSERTEIVLMDTSDTSNGFASVLPYSAIVLYVTAPDDLSTLNEYDDWLPMLIAHEQTHIVHIDNVAGLPALISSILGKQFAPNQLQPHWLLEGLAVYAESQLSGGGRLRSTMFDMFMRADVLDGEFATLDQITHVPRRWPGATLWYLYGSKLIEFIAHTYGDSVFAAMAADTADDIFPFAVNRPLHRVTGRTYTDVYAAFKASAEQRVQRQMALVQARGIREGRRLTFHGRGTASPRFVPAHCWKAMGTSGPALLYFRDDGHDTPGIALGELKPNGGAIQETLLVRSNGGNVSVTPHCDLLLQSNAPSRRLHNFNDLFLLQRGTRAPRGWEAGKERLTVGRRARDPDVSHDGRSVAYVTDRAGTTTLRLAALTADQHIENERPVFEPQPDEQVFTPRFSPDDRSIAFGVWTRGGYRDLRIYDRLTASVTTLWRDRATDQEPSWSPDGRWLFFSSNRSGISNIYAWDTVTHAIKQVTNVRTGAFMPEISPDGRQLVYVGYTSAGFDLYEMPLQPTRWTDAPEYAGEPDERLFIDDRGTLPVANYNPLPTLRPRALILEYSSDGSGQRLAASVSGSDVVGLHSLSATAVFQPSNGQPDLYGTYSYSGYRDTLTAGLSRTTDPRARYRYGNSSRLVRRERTTATSSVVIPLPGEHFAQVFQLGYAASHVDAYLPAGTLADPYAPVSRQPFRGFTSSVRASYQFSSVERFLYSVGAERGQALSLYLERFDKRIGSDLEGSVASARAFTYHPLPWKHHHVLALGATLGASEGTATGGYALGGYQDSPLLTSILNGVPQSRLSLRGYASGQFEGSHLVLLQSEYRFPLLWVDRGIATLPVFLRGFSAALGTDYGGAFYEFDNRRPWQNLHLGLTAELWTSIVLGYGLDIQMALGYSLGTSTGAIPGGTSYLVVSSGL